MVSWMGELTAKPQSRKGREGAQRRGELIGLKRVSRKGARTQRWREGGQIFVVSEMRPLLKKFQPQMDVYERRWKRGLKMGWLVFPEDFKLRLLIAEATFLVDRWVDPWVTHFMAYEPRFIISPVLLSVVEEIAAIRSADLQSASLIS